MAQRILVIGATGKVGGHLLEALEHKGHTTLAATRDPNTAAERTGAASEFTEFDLDRPETFAPALDGVDRVFLIARPGDEHPERAAFPLIDEMKRQGVRHVVNLTAMGVEGRNDLALRKVELYLEDSGIALTHLRPNWFMQVFCSGPLLADILATGAFHIPAADAKVSYIDARDIASVAAAALTEPGHEEKAYTLTGGRALDHHEIARIISEAAHKPIQYVPITDEQAVNAITSAGLSVQRAERLIGFYRLVRQEFSAAVSPDVQEVLGRPPAAFESFAADNASCWS